MKVLTITLVLVAASIACILAEGHSSKLIEECQIEAQVPEDERELSFKNSNFDPKNASNSIKCAHKCFMERVEAMANDQLNAEAILRHAVKINEDHVRQVVDKCNRETGIDDCDAAFQKAWCLWGELGANSEFSAK